MVYHLNNSKLVFVNNKLNDKFWKCKEVIQRKTLSSFHHTYVFSFICHHKRAWWPQYRGWWQNFGLTNSIIIRTVNEVIIPWNGRPHLGNVCRAHNFLKTAFLPLQCNSSLGPQWRNSITSSDTISIAMHNSLHTTQTKTKSPSSPTNYTGYLK